MDSDSLEKFGLAFALAVLFHLLLVFSLILGLSFESEVALQKPVDAMQATILEMPSVSEEDMILNPANKLSRAEQKRLARAKRQALRMEQMQKQKLLAEAAQKLVLETIQAKKRTQEMAAMVQKIKSLWIRPVGTKGMACIIRVELSANGQVKKAAIEQSSGNKLFDDSAKNAVYKAGQFQIPDNEELRRKVLEGISVPFGDE